jgi:hypothetical protein
MSKGREFRGAEELKDPIADVVCGRESQSREFVGGRRDDGLLCLYKGGQPGHA